MRNLPLNLLRTLIFAAAVLFVVVGGRFSRTGAQEPAAESPTAENPTAENPAADLTLYISPTKLIRTQSCESLLNSPEWADFFGDFVERFDATHLRRTPESRLMSQLTRTFGKTPCSMNDPLNLLSFNFQGIWANFELTNGFKVVPADPFLTFVSDFSPTEMLGLTGAFLDQAHYPQRESAPNTPAVFGAEGKEPLLLDLISPLPGDTGKSAFFLTRSAAASDSVRAKFPPSDELKNALSGADPVFLLCGLSRGGLRSLADSFAALESDSPASAFAPGMSELAKRVESVWLSAQETSGVTTLTLTIFCAEDESSADLGRLINEVRTLLRQWSEGKELTAFQALWLDTLERAELIQENERLYVVFPMNAPETFEKIKKCFIAWKK